MTIRFYNDKTDQFELISLERAADIIEADWKQEEGMHGTREQIERWLRYGNKIASFSGVFQRLLLSVSEIEQSHGYEIR